MSMQSPRSGAIPASGPAPGTVQGTAPGPNMAASRAAGTAAGSGTGAGTAAGAGMTPDHTGFYSAFFGFRERPFTLVPDPDLVLWSRQYRLAFSVLEFGIASRSPITLLTGAIGCGKTTLLRELLRRLEADLTVGLISNAQGGRGELLQWVLNAIGLPFDPGTGYVQLFQRLTDFLISEYAAGRRVILVFDEAQNLSQDSLEELRMLTNINTGKDELVQLVLVGQPELRDMIRHPGLVQLAQRIAVSCHLEPLNAETTSEFVVHRLRAVGGSGAEFEPEARARVHEVTGGVPRLINQLCDIALLYAWTMKDRTVDAATIEAVLEDGILFAAQGAGRGAGPQAPAAPAPAAPASHPAPTAPALAQRPSPYPASETPAPVPRPSPPPAYEAAHQPAHQAAPEPAYQPAGTTPRPAPVPARPPAHQPTSAPPADRDGSGFTTGTGSDRDADAGTDGDRRA